MELIYFSTAAANKYLPVNAPKVTQISISLLCDTEVKDAPVFDGVATIYGAPDFVGYSVTMTSYAGCFIHEAKNPYWYMGLWPSTYLCFVITLIVGLIICFYGKFCWKFTNFVAGFGCALTILETILYPSF